MVFGAPIAFASDADTKLVLSSLVTARNSSQSATLASAKVVADAPLPQITWTSSCSFNSAAR